MAADLLHPYGRGLIALFVAERNGQVGIEVVSVGGAGGMSDAARLGQEHVHAGVGPKGRIHDQRSMKDEFEVSARSRI